MKPLKIIELSYLDKSVRTYISYQENEVYVADSWAGLIARRLVKYLPELDIETWRTRIDYKNVFEKEYHGIKGIIWPYRKPFVKNILTYSMLKRLYELRKKHFIILHYHNLFDLRFIIFSKFLPPDIKIVLSHHGGIPPYKNKLKSFFLYLFLKYKNISYITYISPKIKDYLKKIKNHPENIFLPVGADYDMHNIKSKNESRRKLGLDQGKIYGIYVGKFYKFKNVDLILDAYKKFKKKYNFSVIFVGGRNNPENDLYKDVVESRCPYFGIQKDVDMNIFYNAADFYIHPAFNPEHGGIDVSWMEALACNIPVLSPKLSNLDFDYSELGLCPVDYNDFLEKLMFMIENHHKFKNCRKVSKRYLDGNTSIMEKLLNIYKGIYNGCLKNKTI